MSERDDQIEQVVQAVLDRLRPPAPARASAPAACPAAATSVSAQQIVNARVVTIAELAGMPESVRRVLVPPKAVVTPSARDLLRDRGIELAYREPPDPDTGAAQDSPALVVGIAKEGFCPANLLAALDRESIAAQRIPGVELAGVVREVSGRLASREARVALVITDRQAAALCLANRYAAVRAVAAERADAACAAARSVGANALVADPGRQSGYELARMAARFATAAPYACPHDLESALQAFAPRSPSEAAS